MIPMCPVMTAESTKTDRLDELSLKQAAYYVNVSVKWMRRRLGKKDGPPYRRRGKKYKFPREELIQWATQQKVK